MRYFHKIKKAIEQRNVHLLNELLNADEFKDITDIESTKLFEFALKWRSDSSTINILLNTLPNLDLSILSEAFFIAMESHNLIVVEPLLKAGMNPNNNEYPLHFAIYQRSREIVWLLIKYGADINRQDDVGNTPLLEALVTGDEEIALKLIDLGADIRLENNLGLMPIHAAYNYQFTQTLNLLKKQKNEINPALSPVLLTEDRARLISEWTLFLSGELNDGYEDYRLNEALILINFFSLDAEEQIKIIPQLERVADFGNSQGDLWTNEALEGFALGFYEDIMRRLGSSLTFLEEDGENHAELAYAVGKIYSYLDCNYHNENLYSPNMLAKPQWTLVRLLSQYIRDYLEIEFRITAVDMTKLIPPYVDA
jgi:ankyrin repeat protein